MVGRIEESHIQYGMMGISNETCPDSLALGLVCDTRGFALAHWLNMQGPTNCAHDPPPPRERHFTCSFLSFRFYILHVRS